MAYGQINYPQELGTGTYTIAEAGCFLVAFCNLLQRFGNNIDPVALNQFFINDNKYTHDPSEPAGRQDNLYWGAVSAYDGQIISAGVGGAGWPDSNDAIVKFIYKSPRTGAQVTHFCLVQDAGAHTIVDSWDGNVKVSPYGTPVAWAKYERHQSQVVTPPPPSESPAFSVENIAEKTYVLNKNTDLWDLNQRSWPGLVNNPVRPQDAGYSFKTTQIAHQIMGGSYYIPEGEGSHGFNVVDCNEYVPPPPTAPPSAPLKPSGNPDNKYDVIKPIPGYTTATNAGNHTNQADEVQPGSYFVYNTHANNSDLINVTSKLGQPGSWINKADNVPDPEPTPPAPEPEAAPAPPDHVETEPAASTAPLPWQETYKPFPKPVHYVTTRSIIVADLSGQEPDVALPRYDDTGGHEVGVVSSYGTVTKDGIEYYRLRTNNDPDFKLWYSVPKVDAETHTPNLLVKPVEPAAPVSKVTVARDGLALGKAKIETELGEFFDILPKWFSKNKK